MIFHRSADIEGPVRLVPVDREESELTVHTDDGPVHWLWSVAFGLIISGIICCLIIGYYAAKGMVTP